MKYIITAILAAAITFYVVKWTDNQIIETPKSNEVVVDSNQKTSGKDTKKVTIKKEASSEKGVQPGSDFTAEADQLSHDFEENYEMFHPINDEHKEWLVAHHYPRGEFHIEQYSNKSISELEKLAYAGDVIAKKELGTKLITVNGDIENGLNWLKDAAADGSHYALNELSVLNAAGLDTGLPKNLLEGLAWKRVSYILGDWSALWSDNIYTSQLGQRDIFIADILAASYFLELNDIHIQRYGSPLTPDLKPGLLETLQLINENSEH